jgi:hypothetical protein
MIGWTYSAPAPESPRRDRARSRRRPAMPSRPGGQRDPGWWGLRATGDPALPGLGGQVGKARPPPSAYFFFSNIKSVTRDNFIIIGARRRLLHDRGGKKKGDILLAGPFTYPPMLPAKRRLSVEGERLSPSIGAEGFPTPTGRRSRRSSEDSATGLVMANGETSYERPPPSALLTTFQRLGFSTTSSPSGGETWQDPKRLRVCVGDTRPPSEMDSPTAEMELPGGVGCDSPLQPNLSSW